MVYWAQRHPEISATEPRKAAQQRRQRRRRSFRCKQQWMTSYHLIHAPSTQTHRNLSHRLEWHAERPSDWLTDKPTWLTNLQTGAESWNRNRITIAISATLPSQIPLSITGLRWKRQGDKTCCSSSPSHQRS